MSDFVFDPSQRWSVAGVEVDSLDSVASECHKNAIEHGFNVSDKLPQLVALMSEFGEWCEALRKGDTENEQEEIVDMLVRIFAYAVEHYPDTWQQCLNAKMVYNKSRTHKHGKNF